MLPRAAVRIFNGRSAPSTFRTLHPVISIRTFANDGRSDRPVGGQRGPVKNQTWAPANAQSQKPQNENLAFDNEDLERSGTARAILGHQARASSNSPASSQPPDKDTDTTAAHEVHNASEELPNARYRIPPEGPEPFSTDAATDAPPSTPLPDLRQGIPSQFNIDTSDKSSSFKTKDSEPPSLDLTEDPARGGGSKRSEGLPRDAYTTSIERRRLRLARYMYMALFGSIVAGLIVSGRNWDSEEEAEQYKDAPSGWTPMAFYNRIKARISTQMGRYTEPAFPKLLPTLDATMARPYTLVLSLEDLLVHSEWSREHGWRLAKRPGVDYFLRYLSQYYELVVFTSVQSVNAEPIIRKLDPYQIIMWPLFREATRYVKGEHVKDLSYLNRDLSKTIIIDTNNAHVQLQPENAVILSKWLGDAKANNKNDLISLIPFLEYIAAMSIGDVRQVLQSYEGKDIPAEYAARELKARKAFNEKYAEQRGKRKWGLSSAFKFGQSTAMPGEQSLEEALAEGKMPIDVVRERGMLQYKMLEKEIRENGQKWLDEMAREQKKMQEESMKAMQSGMSGFMGNVFGGSGQGSSDSEGKPSSA